MRYAHRLGGRFWLMAVVAVGCGSDAYEQKLEARREGLKHQLELKKHLDPIVVPKSFRRVGVRAPRGSKTLNVTDAQAAFDRTSGDVPMVFCVVAEEGKTLSSEPQFIEKIRRAIGQVQAVRAFVLSGKSKQVTVPGPKDTDQATRTAALLEGDGTLMVRQSDGQVVPRTAGFVIYLFKEGSVQAALVYGFDRDKAAEAKKIAAWSVEASWVGQPPQLVERSTAAPEQNAGDTEAGPSDRGAGSGF